MHVRVGDVRLFFDVEGAKLVTDGAAMRERPTVLLLHGGPGFDHSTYKPLFTRLAEHAQVVYLDHRGQGRSEKSEPERWTLDQWADDVRGFCEALGIERPVVLGELVRRHGRDGVRHPAPRAPGEGRVLEHLGAPEPAAHARPLRRARRARGAARGGAPGRRLGRTRCRTTSTRPSPRTGAPRDPNANARTRWALDVMFHFAAGEDRTFDLLEGLSRVRCPALVVGGALDPVCPIEDQEEIAAALRRSSCASSGSRTAVTASSATTRSASSRSSSSSSPRDRLRAAGGARAPAGDRARLRARPPSRRRARRRARPRTLRRGARPLVFHAAARSASDQPAV